MWKSLAAATLSVVEAGGASVGALLLQSRIVQVLKWSEDSVDNDSVELASIAWPVHAVREWWELLGRCRTQLVGKGGQRWYR